MPNPDTGGDRRSPIIVASRSPDTTGCIATAKIDLESAGFDVLVFPSTSTGSQTMEALIASGTVAGVLDLTLSSIARTAFENQTTTRLQATAHQSLPSVVAPGGVDLIHSPAGKTPPVRTTPEQNTAIATLIAEKLNHYPIPPTVALPLQGVSSASIAGTTFHDPDADHALFSTLKQKLNPDITVIESDYPINHPTFAHLCTGNLLDDLNA